MTDFFKPPQFGPPHERFEGLESATASLTKPLSEVDGKPNQDSSFEDSFNQTFGVFDGMGGHAAGDIASRMAKKIIAEAANKIPNHASISEMQHILAQAFAKTNQELLDEAARMNFRGGMGTTATVMRFFEDEDGKRQALIAHVGDSRAYRLRGNGPLEQLTSDDGISAIFVDKMDENSQRLLQRKLNNVTRKEDLTDGIERFMFENRNILKYALGIEKTKTSFWVTDVQKGDRFLMCSDGVSDNLTDIEIEELLAAADTAQTASSDIALTARRVSERIYGRNKTIQRR